MQRTDSLEKTLMLEKIEGRRRRGRLRTRLLDAITDLMDMSLRKLQKLVIDREASHAAGHRVAKSQTRLSDWIDPTSSRTKSPISSIRVTHIALGCKLMKDGKPWKKLKRSQTQGHQEGKSFLGPRREFHKGRCDYQCSELPGGQE